MTVPTLPMRPAAALVIAGLVSAGAPVPAAAVDDGQWHFRVTPYLWLPSMTSSADTTVSAPGGVPRDLDVTTKSNPNGYLSDLNMAVMLSAEARRGEWSILTDIIYVDFGNQELKLRHAIYPDRQLPVLGSKRGTVDLSATVWTLAGGYSLVDSPAWSLDVLAGARYLDLSSDFKVSLLGPNGRYLRTFEGSSDQSVLDGIVGLRGRVSIAGTKWFVPFYADIGAGDAELTWQAMLGVGYRFDWGETTLAWRALGYELDDDSVDLTMSGPGLSASFTW